MTCLKSRLKNQLIVAILCISSTISSNVFATVIEEGAEDIGELLDTALVLSGGVTNIIGNSGDAAAGDFADLYKFYWGGGTFFATTEADDYDYDESLLFLFDLDGYLLQRDNDNRYDDSFLEFEDLAIGWYFLGHSHTNAEIHDASVDSGGSHGEMQVPGDGPLDHWYLDPDVSDIGDYEIQFRDQHDNYFATSNAPVPDVNPVPEPATLAIFALGMFGLIARKRKT